MDECHKNVNVGKADSRSPSRAEPDVSYAVVNFKNLSASMVGTDLAESDVSYAEVNFKTLPASQLRTDRDGQNTTYSELNVRKNKPRIDADEDPHMCSGAGGLSTTAETAAQERESKVKIRNRPYRLICLLCLVTSAFIVTVAGLSIYVSQIRQTNETCHRNSNLPDLTGMHSDLRHQFTEMETKYRSVNETKAQICELLTSRREQTCSKDWVTNKGRCYYVSTFETSFRQASQECSNRDSRLLEVNTRDEASFVSRKVLYLKYAYWIGKCEVGNVSLGLLHNMSPGQSVCIDCESYVGDRPCDRDHRFICEKSAPLFPDIPEKIQGLCQQPVDST